MLNYNNKLLVDIRLLLRARERYRLGSPLSVIFEELKRDCTNDSTWVDKNEELAHR